MSVFAVTMAKDEADVIGATVSRMIAQVDHVIVADNCSTDGTREILSRMSCTVVEDSDPAYHQSQKMTALAQKAREEGAEWVVCFDADEIWATEGRIADALAGLPDEVLVCEAAVFDHVATAQDGNQPNPIRRMRWRRPEQLPLRKVACRPREGMVVHQGNHAVSYLHTPHPPAVTNLLEVRHFPYRSPEQLCRKVRNGAAAYAATDLDESVGAHWRQWGQLLDEQGADALADIFHKWYWREDPAAELTIEGERQPALVFDPAPA